ncbi:MAG: outer membrane beta-barrel protein [Acetobacteraceae bacterium]|nr:porin [Pseudomonadota bacterium]
MIKTRFGQGAWIVAAATIIASAPALAQAPAPAAAPDSTTSTAAPVPAADAPPPGYWINGIRLSAQLDAGVMFNPFRPNTGLNWGQLFTDHANQVQMNQLLLTASKPLDPKDSNFQWGFKFQFMYGSDARYTQFLGELNRAIPGARYQMDIVEANVLFHLPVLTEGGIDLKAGQYSTPIGFETIDPSTNYFYSHSYIFQFGLPFKHTGALTTTHVNDWLDIYAGIDTGTNTTMGILGDNNGAVGGIGGFNLTLMGGNLTILALTHVGPEYPTRILSPLGINGNGQWRSFSDIVINYKISDYWSSTTEFNWVRDAYGYANRPVNGFGVAQYFSYQATATIALNARVELWRDDNNFFVASYSGNNDPIRVQQGLSPQSGVYVAPGGGGTTYGALTLGATWKPEMPAAVTGLAIRPEVRWDHAFTSNNPFNQNPPAYTKGTSNSFTFGADVVLTF